MTFVSSRVLIQSVRCLMLMLVTAMIGSGISLDAQSVLGSISGTVRDSSGAVVPKAKVVLHRVETNTDRTVTTDNAGNYNAINVEAGTYDITTTAGGFSANVGTGVPLISRQQLEYDVTLRVTANNQTVTVNASDVGVIDTENAQISASLSPRDVQDLPANYRGA
jgi:hypothetical protein